MTGHHICFTLKKVGIVAAEGLTLEAWLKKLADEAGSSTGPRFAQEAVDRILQLQTRVKPDPEGWTIRDYINHGRP
jgi:hypothetical protein